MEAATPSPRTEGNGRGADRRVTCMLKKASLPNTRRAIMRPATHTSALSSSTPGSKPSHRSRSWVLECVACQLTPEVVSPATGERIHHGPEGQTQGRTREPGALLPELLDNINTPTDVLHGGQLLVLRRVLILQRYWVRDVKSNLGLGSYVHERIKPSQNG